MPIGPYLVMTAAEFSVCTDLPPYVGWMACHFSPSGAGLSNIPASLPPRSLLIVDDSTPFHQHQPEVILEQLLQVINKLDVRAVILDFQRPNVPQVQALVSVLQQNLPCSVVATPEYTKENSPVFLPPCPLHRPLKIHLAPYQGRELWLDISPLPAQIAITPKGSHYETLTQIHKTPHWEPTLHCNYNIDIEKERIVFTLRRDHESWLKGVKELGVTAIVGLYQEWS